MQGIRSVLLHPDMEAPLEWILMLAVGASALCMLALAMIFALGKYRARRKRENERGSASDQRDVELSCAHPCHPERSEGSHGDCQRRAG